MLRCGLLAMVLMAASGCAALGGTGGTMKVFVLTGGANMEGAASRFELPAAMPAAPKNVRLYGNGAWGPLLPGDGWGPELSFGRAMGEAWPGEQIGIVKFTAGGAEMEGWLPEQKTGATAPPGGTAPAGGLYPRLIAAVRQATQGRRALLAGVIWMQGEGDSRTEAAAKGYYERLKSLIERVRNDLSEPDLPFVIGQVNLSAAQGYAFADEVRAAQARITREVPHVALVSTDGLGLRPDGLHFDAQGLTALGERLCAAYLVLTARDGALPPPVSFSVQVETGR